MAHCFDQSHQAYENGDGARAKQLSEEGKRHKAEMERLNKEASDWIYYRKWSLYQLFRTTSYLRTIRLLYR